MRADRGAAAHLAFASLAVMLLESPQLLHLLLSVEDVLAIAGAATALAVAPSAVVLTDGGAAAVACASLAAVLTDGGAAAELALASFAVVLADGSAAFSGTCIGSVRKWKTTCHR